MPPKSRGRPKRSNDKANDINEEEMSTRKPVKGKGKVSANRSSTSAVPDVFRDMVAEAVSSSGIGIDGEERPRKRRRVRQPIDGTSQNSALPHADHDGIYGDDETSVSVEFENVIPSKQEQIVYNDFEDASSESDLAWEEVGITDYTLKPNHIEDNGDLDLTLSTMKSPQRSSTTRRKTLSKAERALRLDIHKMHLLCILSHVDRRNNWCNDADVQHSLKSLLNDQMVECLQPKESHTQFRRGESVKKGLSLVTKMWESKYSIAAKGMQRPFWAESEREIQDFKMSPESDSLHEKSEFRLAATELRGSRDVGAQLFCALLRSTGLDVRLVCSLQLLPFAATSKAPPSTVLNAPPQVAKPPAPEVDRDKEPINIRSAESLSNPGDPSASRVPATPRRRLGNPNAARFFMRFVTSPPPVSPEQKRKQNRISESPYPVFWVEVLNEAYQKWMPVNPMNDASLNKPHSFEPPASDSGNNMSYVVAFEDDGAARDVTRRYTKTFTAKTRKNRVESIDGGERWWRRTMRFYSRGWSSDLDQIEDTELAASEAREPMPKSVIDFKDHPIYALERHLRRNEVLVNPKEVGKVPVGRDGAGGKKLESVYRRGDVRLVKSADGWYRIGREVKVGEQPVKIVTRKKREDLEEDADGEDSAATALYTFDQTELYEPPPVVSGRVPKNSYGNLDIFVPSMVPKGGIHIPNSEASRAARLLALDYADAVTGFEFRGRRGTAIIRGIVAATEFKEAIEAVIEGFQDEQARAEEEMRSLVALRQWKRFMVGLRIKERVDAYEVEDEGKSGHEAVEDGDSRIESEENFDDGGGGFFPE